MMVDELAQTTGNTFHCANSGTGRGSNRSRKKIGSKTTGSIRTRSGSSRRREVIKSLSKFVATIPFLLSLSLSLSVCRMHIATATP
jgi:hypothetical protein